MNYKFNDKNKGIPYYHTNTKKQMCHIQIQLFPSTHHALACTHTQKTKQIEKKNLTWQEQQRSG